VTLKLRLGHEIIYSPFILCIAVYQKVFISYGLIFKNLWGFILIIYLCSTNIIITDIIERCLLIIY
jgi:hypothetical protein